MPKTNIKYPEVIQVTVESEVRAWVKEQAEALGHTESSFMRMLIKKFRSSTSPKTSTVGDCN